MTKLACVRSSLCGYLNRESQERAQLRATLNSISEGVPETVIFGGMLREFGWGHARRFSSDIDLVSMASRSDIYAAIRNFSPTSNKFGGFRFIAGRRLFDIWALEDTWAFRERLVSGAGFKALFNTTFFGVDAATFHLRTKRYEFSAAHLSGLRDRVLELNLRENASPQKMIRRAIRIAINGEVAIGPLLADYIVEHYRWDNTPTTQNSFVRALEEHVFVGTGESFRFQPQMAVISP